MKRATRNTPVPPKGVQHATFLIMILFALAACSTISFVKPVEVTKDTAEAVLYEARAMQNRGIITSNQFDTIRTAYDALKVAQDTVIDARIAYLKDGTETKEAILNAALVSASKNLAAYSRIASDLGIIGGK